MDIPNDTETFIAIFWISFMIVSGIILIVNHIISPWIKVDMSNYQIPDPPSSIGNEEFTRRADAFLMPLDIDTSKTGRMEAHKNQISEG